VKSIVIYVPAKVFGWWRMIAREEKRGWTPVEIESGVVLLIL
jgi:hypothetical protein